MLRPPAQAVAYNVVLATEILLFSGPWSKKVEHPSAIYIIVA